MYLLPAIDILEGKVVRLAKGDYNKVTIYHDNPVAQAQVFEEAGAEWLHIVDLDGARTGAPVNLSVIEAILAKTLLKVEIGGGIRTLDAIQRLYDAGVTRVILGTSLVADPDFAQAAIERYKGLLGAGIDAKGGEVAIAGWREGAGIAAEELVAKTASCGFRHLVYTDIARDGMQTGIDPAAYVRMAEVFGNPVIASGGVASIEDIHALGKVASSIERVIAGRAIYENTLDVAKGVEACKEATRKAEAMKVAQNPCGGCSC